VTTHASGLDGRFGWLGGLRRGEAGEVVERRDFVVRRFASSRIERDLRFDGVERFERPPQIILNRGGGASYAVGSDRFDGRREIVGGHGEYREWKASGGRQPNVESTYSVPSTQY
jgi:hypothetical protein